MQHEMLFMLEKETVFCVWENGDRCNLPELPKYLEKNGSDFVVATLLDEEELLKLGSVIQNIFAEKKKTSTVN